MKLIKVYAHIFFLSIIFLSGNIVSQEVRGKVLDKETKQALSNVSIFLTKNNKIGTTTNEKGEFFLDIKKSNLTSITFSIIGYNSLTIHISQLKNSGGIIHLTRENNLLHEISIISPKKQEKLKYTTVGNLESELSSFASVRVDDKLYISGGDKSNLENGFLATFERASASVPQLSQEALNRFWTPSLNYRRYSNKIYEFDLKENKLRELPTHLKSNRAYHKMYYFNGNLYVLGGKKLSVQSWRYKEYLSNDIEIYNLAKNTIKSRKVNLHQAANFGLTGKNEYLFLMGGSKAIKNKQKVFSEKISYLNLKNGNWYVLGEMKNPKETNTIQIGNYIYTFGGNNGKPTDEITSWNVITGEWSTIGKLFYPIENAALTKYKNDIYIFEQGKILVYNVIKKTLKQYYTEIYLKNANLHYYDYALYILGGLIPEKYSTRSSDKIYRIDLLEMKITKVTDFKKFNSSSDKL